jgi:hypothetical protein
LNCLKKKLRYAVIIRNNSYHLTNSILDTFSDVSNKYGEYIKIIIGSPITKMGLNLSHCQSFHLVGPNWDPGSEIQALNRIFRATSHVDLYHDKQNNPDLFYKPKEKNIIAKVYQHAAVSKTGDSIDSCIYQISDKRQLQINKFLNILKFYAIDRFLFQTVYPIIPADNEIYTKKDNLLSYFIKKDLKPSLNKKKEITMKSFQDYLHCIEQDIKPLQTLITNDTLENILNNTLSIDEKIQLLEFLYDRSLCIQNNTDIPTNSGILNNSGISTNFGMFTTEKEKTIIETFLSRYLYCIDDNNKVYKYDSKKKTNKVLHLLCTINKDLTSYGLCSKYTSIVYNKKN